MGENAEELKSDIAQTRAELGRDLDALGDRVSPRRMMERRRNRAGRWINDARDRILGTVTGPPHAAADHVSDAASSAVDMIESVPDRATQATRGNPGMAGMVAFGVGFLLGMALAPTDTEQQVVERLEPHLEPLKGELASSARDVADSVKETGREVADDLQASAKGHVESVKETASSSRPASTAGAGRPPAGAPAVGPL